MISMKRLIYFLLFLVLLPHLCLSQVTEEESRWRDWVYSGIQPKGYVFFSTLFMNESKYFVIYGDGNYYKVSRFDSHGVLEETRSYDYGYSNMVGNSLNLNWGDVVLIPVVIYDSGGSTVDYQHILGLLVWNVSDYIAGNHGITIYQITPVEYYSPERTYDYVSISNIMSKGAYPSGILDNNQTIAVTYKDVTYGYHYIVYDFYDLENYQLTLSSLKKVRWDAGLSDIKRAYVYASQGNCFQYTDCVFQIVFEGRSEQNDNRYGIYVREGRKGAFGWEWTDKGLIGFETSTGFETQISGIDYWTTQHHYDYLSHKIYLKAIQGNNRIYAWVKFTPTWTYLSEGSFNVYSNGFVYKAQILPYVGDVDLLTPGGYYCTGKQYKITYYNTTGMTDYIYLTIRSLPSVSDVHVYVKGEIVDSYNSSITQTFSDFWYYPDGEVAVTRYSIPGGSGVYNITVSIVFYGGNACWGGTGRISVDVLPNAFTSTFSDFTFNSIPFFFPTVDVQGDIEAFSITLYVPGTLRLIDNVNYFGVQTVSYACRCTDWVSQGCYNSTHELWTRTCNPAGCSDETMFVENPECSVYYVPPVTTTTIPQIPLLNVSEVAELYNITDTKVLAFMTMISLFTTPIFIASIILVGIVGYIGFKAGKIPAVIAALVLFFIYVFLGIYPIWLGIVLIIIAGFILTIIFREAF